MWIDDYIKDKEKFKDELKHLSSKEYLDIEIEDEEESETDEDTEEEDEFHIIFGPLRGRIIKTFGFNIVVKPSFSLVWEKFVKILLRFKYNL